MSIKRLTLTQTYHKNGLSALPFGTFVHVRQGSHECFTSLTVRVGVQQGPGGRLQKHRVHLNTWSQMPSTSSQSLYMPSLIAGTSCTHT